MLNPVAVSIISSVFKGREERDWAIGIWISMFGVSMALGPVLGGILTSAVGWRSIFWVNVPIGLTAIALAARYIPESRPGALRRPDLVAQVLVIVMLGSLIYAIIEGARTGWREPGIRGLFGLAGVAFVVLVLWDLRRKDPLIDPRFFRNLPFTGAVLTGICAFGCLGGFLFLGTLYLQDTRGLPALDAGLHMLPAAAAMAVCPLLAARLAARNGLRVPLTLGGAALALSMAAMSRLTAFSGDLYLIAAFMMFGIGLGMVDGQISTAAVSAMPPSQAGLASGIASASRQVGQALGVAISGALLNTNLHGPVQAEFASASRPAWLLLTGCGCAVLVLGLTTTRPLPQHGTAEVAGDSPAERAAHGPAGEPETLPRPASVQPQTFQDQEPPLQDLEPPTQPIWVPRDPVTQQPGYPGPASGNPSILTRRDQVYYRRRWRADDGRG